MERIHTDSGLFDDGTAAAGYLDGTPVSAKFLNDVQEEVCAVIAAAGIPLDGGRRDQLLAAIRAIGSNAYAPILQDVGPAANSYEVANAVPYTPSTLAHGVRQAVQFAHANTGASSLAVDGLPDFPIYGLNLEPLQGGEISESGVGQLVFVVHSTVNNGNGGWVLLNSVGGAVQIAPASKSLHAVQFGQVPGLIKSAGLIYSGQVPLNASRALAASDVGAMLLNNGPFTLSVPKPSAIGITTSGFCFTLMNYGANTCTVAFIGGASYTYGAASLTSNLNVLSGECITFMSSVDAIGWIVVSSTAQLSNVASFAGALNFQKLPGGYMEQWGTTPSIPALGSAVFTLPSTFPVGTLGAWVTPIGGTPGILTVTATTASTVTVSNGSSGSASNPAFIRVLGRYQ